MDDAIASALADHRAAVDSLEALTPRIRAVADRLEACIRAGGKVCWLGNGGSAADAQHLAAEMVGRYLRERRPLPALALTTDTSVLTAVANDTGFERVFARQVEALCEPPDVVVAMSTSGQSPNVLAAVASARTIGCYTVGLTGPEGGELARAVDAAIAVDAADTGRVQEMHALIGHIWCSCLEDAFGEG